jgi:hypothetical protein
MADDPSRVLRERVALAAPVKVARVVAGATRALTA